MQPPTVAAMQAHAQQVLSKLLPFSRNVWATRVARVTACVAGVLLFHKVQDILKRRWYNLPPGRAGWPIIGILTEAGNRRIMRQRGDSTKRWYTPVSFEKFGFRNVLYLHDYDLSKKFFKQHDDRLFVHCMEPKPFVLDRYAKWKPRRQFFRHSVDLQLNSKSLTQKLARSLTQFIFPLVDKTIQDNVDWSIRLETQYITFAAIFSALLGTPVAPTDASFKKFALLNDKAMGSFSAVNIASSCFHANSSMGKWIAKRLNYAHRTNEQASIINNWYQKVSFEEEDEGIFANKLREKKDITQQQGFADIVVGFQAGTHTTASTLEQCILRLAEAGVSVQDEIYSEILPYVQDMDKLHTLYSHKSKVVHFSSFVNEAMRMNGINFVTIARNVAKDGCVIEVDGKKYNVPKDTVVAANVLGMNMDPKYWVQTLGGKDVNMFDPDRFIDKETNQLMKQTHLCTFGFGKRDCAGQMLAWKEVYVTMAMLIHRYRFFVPSKYGTGKAFFTVPSNYLLPDVPILGVRVEKRN